MDSIIIQTTTSEKSMFEELANIDVDIIEKKNFTGQEGIIEAVCIITISSLPVIGKIIIELIRARKNIVVKHKGLVIKGLTEENTMEILKKILEAKK